MNQVMVLNTIDALKGRLNALRPLTTERIKALRSVFEAEETEYIYESNAIEGNTLTLAETELVLRKGLTVSGKSLKDHLEAKNHQKAFHRLKALADTKTPFSPSMLLDLHNLILRGIDDSYAGRYRDVAVRIAGSRHVPPNPLKVPELMDALFARNAEGEMNLHPVHLAADLHLELSQIHPFVDGNGRVCRLVMNLILLRHGYPLTMIRSERNLRVTYYDALAESDKTGTPDAFRCFVEGRVVEALERYLEVLEESR